MYVYDSKAPLNTTSHGHCVHSSKRTEKTVSAWQTIEEIYNGRPGEVVFSSLLIAAEKVQNKAPTLVLEKMSFSPIPTHHIRYVCTQLILGDTPQAFHLDIFHFV